VCATDAPVSPHQLRRLALRPLLGLARAGSYAAEGSGEIGVAFTTSSAANLPDERLNPYFAAAYEAAHEAVYNCLVAARPAERLDGTMQEEFPIDTVRLLAAGG
jgi:D-aminopeptidase